MTTISFPTITRLTEEADAYAEQYGFRFRQNGDADAFRHAYASAEMTRIFGEAAAAAAGTAYEFSRVPIEGPRFAESNMDLWNNARGREMGRTSTSSQDSAQRARDAVNGDNLITDIGDPRNRYYDDYNTLPTPPVFGPVGFFIRNFDFILNEFYTAARGWSVPRDPLVLDLDGDGIETVGINPQAPVLFDHDADGTRTGTGWVGSDDGLLVLDINGNGTIDTGRELFGDNTRLGNAANASNAANGYQALAQHDSNNDGQVNGADAIYSQLRVWRDLNQDGISQAGELQTLAQTGIASIGVQGTASNTNLGNGNTQIYSGSFTRTNGTAGQSGVAELSGSLLLASNNFYRQFTSHARGPARLGVCGNRRAGFAVNISTNTAY